MIRIPNVGAAASIECKKKEDWGDCFAFDIIAIRVTPGTACLRSSSHLLPIENSYGKTGHIAAWMSEVLDEALCYRIRYLREHNRNGLSDLQKWIEVAGGSS